MKLDLASRIKQTRYGRKKALDLEASDLDSGVCLVTMCLRSEAHSSHSDQLNG